MSHSRPFYIFDTHPIQYRSPVFVALAQKMPGLMVYFFNERFDGRKWWLGERGTVPAQNWNLDLKEGFPSNMLGTDTLGLRGTFQRLRELLSNDRPAGILVFGYFSVENWILWWLCSRMGIPFLFCGDTFTLGPPGPKRWVKQLLLPLFFSRVNQIISVGRKNTEFFLNLGVPSSKIIPAKHCVRNDFFQMSTNESLAIRKKIRTHAKIPEDAFVILFVGRLFERKRPGDILELHRELKNEGSVHTVLVGSGTLEASLRQEARNLPCLSIIGFQDQKGTKEWYQAADLLVVPSAWETWGLVINEAFASHLPAVVTEGCGAAEDLVVSGETGFLYKAGDIASLVHCVKKCIQDRDLLKKLADTAQAKVIQHYGIDQFAEAIRLGFTQAAISQKPQIAPRERTDQALP